VNRVEKALYHLCRVTLGGVFFYAGFIKAMDVTAFAGEISNYEFLSYSWNFVAAATLPYVEMLAGGLLVANARVRPAALVLGGLTLVFMVALATAAARGLDIDCGCFGAGVATTPLAALGRDAVLLLLAVIVFALRGRQA
jgi:putative oxidoreductase